MIFREAARHALEALAVQFADSSSERRRFDDGAQPAEVGCDMLADHLQLGRLWRVHAAADPYLVWRHMEVQPRAFMFGQAAPGKNRRDVRFVGRFVFREPRVAVDAVHRRLRVRDQLRRELAEVGAQSLDDLEHRLADVRLVVVAVSVEPLAAVVPFERAQELERLGGETRGRPGRHGFWIAHKKALPQRSRRKTEVTVFLKEEDPCPRRSSSVPPW